MPTSLSGSKCSHNRPRNETASVIVLTNGLHTAVREPKMQGLLGLTFTLIFAATLVYHFVEGWPYLDAAYFSVMTISTVGYGDITTAIAESLLSNRKE